MITAQPGRFLGVYTSGYSIGVPLFCGLEHGGIQECYIGNWNPATTQNLLSFINVSSLQGNKEKNPPVHIIRNYPNIKTFKLNIATSRPFPFFKFFFGHMSFYGATDTQFGLLVTSPLGFKARMDSLIHSWWRCM